ncbi:pyridoxal phosphate-dependent aminotransferase [Mycobacteroides franklinii]|uniref:Putative N-succinyldiaminopimelate aminotransferase DapC n=1 Tax=Mycobacteroides franklinii TaxID=948102 RepID=A0A4R8QWL0_9MYCO|nr:pyridoxal phosphate-dependent aminotransferase [Mycobacteroides franklinii]ORA56058.1 aminotransferase [Mycobacteroides franklinii]TDH18752.1 putative succinyldiaminopimelate transaminase DapC [Mycobacteroides franklinii]TDZ46385.1 putative N-succinyldiaminopimelate aminotransferase DapC [Mycobacteroides franklinii]TDZ47894.1 putative N-succinyldiaminopimelate aminotransferase DapC [Mycobacteroides franklinii]TDZ60103.1 putative N-succinyldiaminopimelate aminotransferase DapC [Mycobacteroid
MNPKTVERLRPFGATIFAEMSALAVRHDAINLGQGFPDEDGPASMLDAAQQAIRSGLNQYPPGLGTPELRRAITADRLARYGEELDPDTQVLVTVGATEAIAGALLGLVEPGSEVILIEPYYDSYAAVVAMAGAIRVPVPLVPDDAGFALDTEALAAAITPRTAALVINSPHNPTGKVFTDAELARVAELAVEHDLLVISDEVYERLLFDGRTQTPMASLPGMADRTVTISSAAKTFNCTGWKIGWACGTPELVAGVRAAKQFLSYVGGGPFQPAVAVALDTEQTWVKNLRESLQRRRDRLSSALTGLGFEVHSSEGGYFVCADPRPLGFSDGAELCQRLPETVGVAAVPVGAFCDKYSDQWNHLVRFTFAKRDAVIDEAIARLARLGT